MKTLNNSTDVEQFTSRLTTSGLKKVLMLDYDGTLAPFTVERDRARPYPEISTLLSELIDSKETRTVIVSGRTIKSLRHLLETDQLPELWGCHGLERLTLDGTYNLSELSQLERDGIDHVNRWAANNEMESYIERKPSGIAFHWRGLAPDKAGDIKRKILDKWPEASEEYGFELHGFDGGLELRVKRANKGTAVRTIVEETDPETLVAYLGDDATDEDAFEALADRGLKVLVSDCDRPTKADLVLRPPVELVEFLRKWL